MVEDLSLLLGRGQTTRRLHRKERKDFGAIIIACQSAAHSVCGIKLYTTRRIRSMLPRNVRLLVLEFVILSAYFNPVSAIDNMRVAHPSISASVLCLMIANKEGYFKEEGINVEFLSI